MNWCRFLLVLAPTAIALHLSVSARAAIAFDSASDSAYNSDWTTGSDGGTGFGAWSLNPAPDTGQAGFFVGSSANNGSMTPSGNINTAGKSWGMYANSGQLADAIRTFDNALAVGQTFRINMDNGNVQTGGTVGFGLRNGSNNRFEFFFVGGGSEYRYLDSAGSHGTSVAFTDDGLQLAFTLTSADTFSFTINNGSPFTGTLASSGNIDRLRLFNANAGSGGPNDLYFNSLEVVPEPANVALAIFGGLFVLATGWRHFRRRRQIPQSIVP